MKKINVAIVGYGNLGRALEEILLEKDEYTLVAIFSRRAIESEFKTKVVNIKEINSYKGKIDVLFLAVGSYGDIESCATMLVKNFNTIDCFDTHKKLKSYILNLNGVAKQEKTVALSAFGWDPGLMSLMRMLFWAIDKNSPCESFWGKGVSQGHSDALRQVMGVKNAIQYTLPNKEILNKCKTLFNFSPTDYEKHKRICYVAKEPFADKNKITQEILTMPNYFFGYDTQINFVDEKDIERRQKRLYHKGYVFKNFTECSHKTKLQFCLSTTSNPHFTATLMIMGAQAVMTLVKEKNFGAYSIADIPIKHYFANKSYFDFL